MRMGRQQSLSHLPIIPHLPQDPNNQTAECCNAPCEGDGSLNLSVFLAGMGNTMVWG